MHPERPFAATDAATSGTWESHRSLPLGVHAVAEARHFAQRTLSAAGAGQELLASATLVVSELVTNAVLYGYGAATLLLRRDTEHLVVEVSDRSAALPAARVAHDESEIGRGLHIIEACSTDWGVRPDPTGGKVVWCRLRWSRTVGPG